MVYLVLKKDNIGDGEHEPTRLMATLVSLKNVDQKVMDDLDKDYYEDCRDSDSDSDSDSSDDYFYFILDTDLIKFGTDLGELFYDPLKRSIRGVVFTGSYKELTVRLGHVERPKPTKLTDLDIVNIMISKFNLDPDEVHKAISNL